MSYDIAAYVLETFDCYAPEAAAAAAQAIRNHPDYPGDDADDVEVEDFIESISGEVVDVINDYAATHDD